MQKSHSRSRPWQHTGGSFLILVGLFAVALTGCEGLANIDAEATGDQNQFHMQQGIADRSAQLVGLHSPDLDSAQGIHEMEDVFAQGGGWLTTAAYAEHYNWLGYAGGGGLVEKLIRAKNAGFHNVLRVDYVGGTNIPPPGSTSTCPTNVGQARSAPDGTHLGCYLDYIEQMAKRVGDGVNVWIIGNEINLHDVEAQMFYDMGLGAIDPEWYVDVYEAARQRIHSVDGHEEDLVLVAAVSPSKGCYNHNASHQIPQCTISGEEYLRQVLTHLTPSKTDGFSLHAYGGEETLDVALQMFEEGTSWMMGYQEQLNLLDDYGFGYAPVIISEFSRHTQLNNNADAHDTASFIRQAYEGLNDWNNSGGHPVLGAVWFTWNQASFPYENLAGFNGILRDAFTDIASRGYLGQVPGGQSSSNPQPGSSTPDYCSTPGLDNCCDVASLGLNCSTDDQWVDGWYCYQERCVAGDSGGSSSSDDSGSSSGSDSGDSSSSDDSGSSSGSDSSDQPPAWCSPGLDNCCDVSELNLHCDSDSDWVDGWHCYHDACGETPADSTSTPEPSGPPAACDTPNVDNCCHFPPGTEGVPETHAGGICDPDGDGSYDDADWAAGWQCYQQTCG